MPLIVLQISTDALGDILSCRPEHFTVRSGSRPVIEYPRSGIHCHEGWDCGLACPKKVPWSRVEYRGSSSSRVVVTSTVRDWLL